MPTDYPEPRFKSLTLDDGEIIGGSAASSTIREWGTLSSGVIEVDPDTSHPGGSRIHSFTLNQIETTLTITPQVATTPPRLLSLLLFATQDATGTRTILWPSSVRWQGGYSPALSFAPGATDMIQLLSIDAGVTWMGSLAYQTGVLGAHDEAP